MKSNDVHASASVFTVPRLACASSLRIWAEEDLGLMLYDVFDHNQRSHGFRVLGKDERMATPEREGVPVKPEAVFFHARVANSRLDCHPQQVRFVQTKVLEV